MITLGLVLVLLVGGLVTDVVVENGQHLDVTILHQKLTVDSWAFFVAGLATTLVAMIALWLLAKGAARDSRRRREHRELVKEARANAAIREREEKEADVEESPTAIDSTAIDSTAPAASTAPTVESAAPATVAPVAPADTHAGRGVTTFPAVKRPVTDDATAETQVRPVSAARPTVGMDKPEPRSARGVRSRTATAPAADAADPDARSGNGANTATLTDAADGSATSEDAGRTGVFARLRR